MKQKNQLKHTETLITTLTSKNRLLHPRRPGSNGWPRLNTHLGRDQGRLQNKEPNETIPDVFL